MRDDRCYCQWALTFEIGRTKGDLLARTYYIIIRLPLFFFFLFSFIIIKSLFNGPDVLGSRRNDDEPAQRSLKFAILPTCYSDDFPNDIERVAASRFRARHSSWRAF